MYLFHDTLVSFAERWDIKMTIKDEIIKTVDIMVKSAFKNIKTDKTLPAVVTSAVNGKYVVAIDGTNHTVKCAIPNLELKVGQSVWVKIPNGDFGGKHICGVM